MRSVSRRALTGPVVTRPGRSRDAWLPCRIQRLHELTGADDVDTDARRTDAGRSHWALGTGHWTPDGRTRDTRTPTLDADRARKSRPASGHPGTATRAGTANRVAMAAPATF